MADDMHSLSLTIPSTLREFLREAADRERRPMAQLVRVILEDWASERASPKREA